MSKKFPVQSLEGKRTVVMKRNAFVNKDDVQSLRVTKKHHGQNFFTGFFNGTGGGSPVQVEQGTVPRFRNVASFWWNRGRFPGSEMWLSFYRCFLYLIFFLIFYCITKAMA